MENAGGTLEPLDKRRELVGIASEPQLMRAATRTSVAFIHAVLPLSYVAVLPPFCRFFVAEAQIYRNFTAIWQLF